MNLLTGAFTAPDTELPEIPGFHGISKNAEETPVILHSHAAYCGTEAEAYYDTENGISTIISGRINNIRQFLDTTTGAGSGGIAGAAGAFLLAHTPEELLQRLDGTFTLAFCNHRSGEWLLCRDRCGHSRILWTLDKTGKCLRFASSPALLAKAASRVSEEALTSYLHLGTIPAPMTIYEGICRLPAASILRGRLNSTEISLSRWWQPAFRGLENATAEECAEELLPLLKAGVERALNLSGGCASLLLSGGIDSGLIAAIIRRFFPDASVNALTMCYGDGTADESSLAALTAASLGMPLQKFTPGGDGLSFIDEALRFAGEPFGNSSLLAAATAFGTMKPSNVLMGDGGDELFGGYRRYQAMLLRQHFPEWLLTLCRPLLQGAAALSSTPERRRAYASLALPPLAGYASFLNITSAREATALLKEQTAPRYLKDWHRELAGCGITGPLQFNLLDFLHYLPDDGCRKLEYAAAGKVAIHTPLLDGKILDFAAALPLRLRFNAKERKIVLRRLASNMLPPEILNAPKKGFGVPVDELLRREYANLLVHLPESLDSGLLRNTFDKEHLREIIALHTAGKANYGQLLWAIVILDRWNRNPGIQ